MDDKPVASGTDRGVALAYTITLCLVTAAMGGAITWLALEQQPIPQPLVLGFTTIIGVLAGMFTVRAPRQG